MNTIERRVRIANLIAQFKKKAGEAGKSAVQEFSTLRESVADATTRYFELSREKKRQENIVSKLQEDRIRLVHELEQTGLNLDYYQPYMARAIELRDKTEGTLVEGNETIAFTQYGPVIQRIDFRTGDDSSARKMESRTIEGMVPNADGVFGYINAREISFLNKAGFTRHKYLVVSEDPETHEFTKIDSSLNLGAYQEASNLFNATQNYFSTLCPQTEASASNLEASAENAAPADSAEML